MAEDPYWRTRPGGLSSVDFTFPTEPTSGAKAGYKSIEFGIKVVDDPGNELARFAIPSNVIGRDSYIGYYWANQFAFVDGSSSGVDGYIGIQTIGDIRTVNPSARNDPRHNLFVGLDRIAIFSVWQAIDAITGPSNSYCAPYGHEGIGWSCKVRYPWVPGVEYHLRVSNLDADWWRGTIVDVSTGQETIIGSIRVASNWKQLKKNASCFTEYYSMVVNQGIGDEDDGKPLPRVCQYMPKAEVVIFPPVANENITVSEMRPNNYGKCAHVSSFAFLESDEVLTSGSQVSPVRPLVNRTGSIARS